MSKHNTQRKKYQRRREEKEDDDGVSVEVGRCGSGVGGVEVRRLAESFGGLLLVRPISSLCGVRN